MMTDKDFEIKKQIHKDICNKLYDLYVSKNSDYGDSVNATYNKYGLVSYLVRMEDKLNRLGNLYKNTENMKVSDERIEDTLMDLANYSILALIQLEGDK